jgi:hypothetical protein
MILEHITAVFLTLVTVSSVPTKTEPVAKEKAIERCTAVAEMLASAYTAYPDDVQLRTDRINKEREKLEARLGTTDKHIMSAYVALAFYDGKRNAGVIPKNQPINGLYLAAEGAAHCMATTFDRGEL